MADTTTPNLGLVKPEIGASNNTWGDKYNANMDDIDAAFGEMSDDKADADLSNVSQSDARTKVGTGTMAYRAVTISTSAPSGGADGDVWLQYTA